MDKKLRLLIVTPSRRMYDADVDMVILRGEEGEFGVLPGHIPMTTILAYSVMRIKVDGEELEASILGGFVEITGERVIVMADVAEWPDEIDLARAEEAKRRAERTLAQAVDQAEARRAEHALRRSMVRIEVSTYPLIKGNKGS